MLQVRHEGLRPAQLPLVPRGIFLVVEQQQHRVRRRLVVLRKEGGRWVGGRTINGMAGNCKRARVVTLHNLADMLVKRTH